MPDPSDKNSPSSRRSVRYEVERDADVWCLIAIDQDEQTYLVCTYENRDEAERARDHLIGKQGSE